MPKLPTFDPESISFNTWLDFLQQHFILEDTPADKKKATIITHLTPMVYETIKASLHPQHPTDATVTYDILKTTLEEHFLVKKNRQVARHDFALLRQTEGEHAKDFSQRLRHAAMDCDFKATLDERLRDQYIVGLRDIRLKEKVWEDNTLLTFALLSQRAAALEKISMDITAMSAPEPSSFQQHHAASDTIHHVVPSSKWPPRQHATPASTWPHRNNSSGTNHQRANHASNGQRVPRENGQNSTCFRCGFDHWGRPCRFVSAVCNFCGKIGHLKKMCRAKQSQNVHQISVSTPCDESSEDEYFVKSINFCSQQGEKKGKPLTVDVLLNDKSVCMELDTGAAASVINKNTWNRIKRPKSRLRKSKVMLTSYSGNQLSVLGETCVCVKVQGKKYDLNVFVLNDACSTNLFGLPWIRETNAIALV